jgi:hypothetical protein
VGVDPLVPPPRERFTPQLRSEPAWAFPTDSVQ